MALSAVKKLNVNSYVLDSFKLVGQTRIRCLSNLMGHLQMSDTLQLVVIWLRFNCFQKCARLRSTIRSFVNLALKKLNLSEVTTS